MSRRCYSLLALPVAVAAVGGILSPSVLPSAQAASGEGRAIYEEYDVRNPDDRAKMCIEKTRGSWPGFSADKDLDYRYLDGCTLEESSIQKVWFAEGTGRIVDNCGGDPERRDLTTGVAASHTKSIGWSIGGKVGGDLPGLSWLKKTGVDLSWSYNNSTSQTETENVSISVPKERKGRIKVLQYKEVRKGRMRLNFSTPVQGHYIWFVDDVEIVSPTSEAVKYAQDIQPCDGKVIGES